MFTKILAASEKTTFQDAPVLIAERIAEQNSAGLRIVHVIDPGPVMMNQDMHPDPDNNNSKTSSCPESHESSVQNQISDNYPDWMGEKEDFEIKVVTGSPLPEITGYAREIDPDLVVIGHRCVKNHEKRKDQETDGRIGSTASGLVERLHCPVMIANDAIDADRLSFHRILVGIDFSKSCECAMAFASSLSMTYDAKLLAVHMIPIPPYPKYSTDDYQADVDAADKRLRALCRQFAQQADYESLVVGGGHPHLEILKWAHRQSADVIVMGSHTKDNQGKWYPGEAVERVSAQSGVPVVVISDPASLQPWDAEISKRIEEQTDVDRSIHVYVRHPGHS
jgi:nucleotide-binding universal stress UspA family protein